MTYVIARWGAALSRYDDAFTAFTSAREQGADWIALDVRRTADDVIAVYHDAHLPDGRLLAESSADELPADVPLLIAALDACAGLGVTMEIGNLPDDPDYDTQHRVSEALAGLMRSRELDGPVCVASLNIDAIERIKRLAPELPTAWICFDLPNPDLAIDRCLAHGHAGLHAYVSYVDRRLVEKVHRAGLHLHAWTVDAPDRIADLVQYGVDGVVTNVPDIARRVVDRELGQAADAPE